MLAPARVVYVVCMLTCSVNKSVFSVQRRLSTWRCSHLLLSAVLRRCLERMLSIYISCQRGAQQQTLTLLPLVPLTHHSHHPSPLHSFIPALIPPFSANPSHRSLRSFLFHDWLHRLPGLFTDTSEYTRFYLFFIFPFQFLVRAVD